MERTSDKHGPRKDEGLKETEPDPGEVTAADSEDVPPRALSEEEIQRR